MKNRILLTTLLGAGLLFAGMAAAQTQSQPMPQAAPTTPTTSPTQSNNATAANGADSATYNTAKGQVTINSTMGKAPSTASPPPFEQLANGKKYISKEDANAFPPLANDFEYAAHHGNRISKAQYESWLKHLN
jgi:hypothetical protein